jgi:hypothetical protein
MQNIINLIFGLYKRCLIIKHLLYSLEMLKKIYPHIMQQG